MLFASLRLSVLCVKIMRLRSLYKREGTKNEVVFFCILRVFVFIISR